MSSRPALAYDEQVTAGVAAGYAFLASEQPAHTAALALDATLGLGERWSLGTRVGLLLHPAGGSKTPMGFVSLDLLYLVDVLQVVPFAGVGLDGLLSDGLGLGTHVRAGMDYLWSRDLLLGADVRACVFFAEALRLTGCLAASVHASLVFDV
ncbi:MAG: hypothetical protein MJD61_16425 [Proteobacteria bacterium]|nr:hypothetical protein [Pseudomonadota bacterium]